MGKIALLSEVAINQIAAGEVVENTSSVVKELVENAVDSGASEIVIEIQNGGRQLIRVSDNGCGMDPEDAQLCLERHATSKIRVAEEIFSIGSMGFRGEALPSIASISKLVLITCPLSAKEGTLVSVEGGRILSAAPALRTHGTTVEVKQLFYNVPVRKKFQRSPTYDVQEIQRVCSSLALAHTRVGFRLLSDREELLRVMPPSEDLDESAALGERVKALLGAEFYSASRPLQGRIDEIELFGFLSLPHLHRPNRSGQYLIVNGRAITASWLSYCIKEGYDTLLPSQRHPIFVIHLRLPPGMVDVNVHPQKRELRFLQEEQLRTCLKASVREALHGQSQSLVEERVIESSSFQEPAPWTPLERTQWMPSLESLLYEESVQKASEPVSMELKLPLEIPKKLVPTLLATCLGYLIVEPLEAFAAQLCVEQPSSSIVLIDQRRARQRIAYEQLSDRQSGKIESQLLLLPYLLDLSQADCDLLELHAKSLNALGFTCEQIGPRSWAIHSLPAILGNEEISDVCEQLLEALRHRTSHAEALEQLLAERLSGLAARSITSATRLSLRDGSELLRLLCDCRQPSFCPKGKPIVLALSQEQLKKLFQ